MNKNYPDLGKQNTSFFPLRLRPWGLLEGGGILACAATLLGFLAGPFWFLDPFSHFRVQYAAGLLTLALLLLIPRHFTRAALFGVCGLINLGLILPMYFGKPAYPPANGMPLRTMLVNVNTQYGNPGALMDVIRTYQPDLLVLEEISGPWVAELESLAESYPHHLLQPREDNFGIGLYSRVPLLRTEVKFLGGSTVPSIWAELEINGKPLTVLATHPLPPAGRDYTLIRNRQLEEIPLVLAGVTTPVIVIGDLNTTPWNPQFKKLLRSTGLRDSSRGRGVQPTWPSTTLLLRIPIDHVLHSPELYVVNKEIGPAVGSDHYPVVVDFLLSGE